MAQVVQLKDINLNEKNSLRTGLHSFFRPVTRIIEYYAMGELIMLSGRSGAGKSTFVSQEIVSFLDQGEKVGLFSGELPKLKLKNWLYRQMCSRDDLDYVYDADIAKKRYFIKRETIDALDEYYNDLLYVYYYENSIADFKDLRKHILSHINQGVRIFFIDNLMQMGNIDGDNEFRKAVNAVHILQEMCKKHNILVFLVAHPKKVKGDFITMDDIAGRQELFAKVNIVILLQRISEELKHNESSKYVGLDGLIDIAKNRDAGDTGRIRTKMDSLAKRFYTLTDIPEFNGVKDEKGYIAKGLERNKEER